MEIIRWLFNIVTFPITCINAMLSKRAKYLEKKYFEVGCVTNVMEAVTGFIWDLLKSMRIVFISIILLLILGIYTVNSCWKEVYATTQKGGWDNLNPKIKAAYLDSWD